MSVYTYSCITDHDYITCCAKSDTMEKAYEFAVKAAKDTEKITRAFFGDDAAVDFVSNHRVFFVGENGDNGILGANVHKTDEPTMYSLYVGVIGEDLILVDESEDYDFLVDNFHKTMDKTCVLMSLISDEDEIEYCKNNMLGIITKSNDRNFIHFIN